MHEKKVCVLHFRFAHRADYWNLQFSGQRRNLVLHFWQSTKKHKSCFGFFVFIRTILSAKMQPKIQFSFWPRKK